jgi:hypothetical protein
MEKWLVKHGEGVYYFKTLKEAREYAQLLNQVLGYNFTIISKVNQPRGIK